MAYNAETQRLQRLARNNWATIYATAVDADVWGQVDDAMGEYEKYASLLSIFRESALMKYIFKYITTNVYLNLYVTFLFHESALYP